MYFSEEETISHDRFHFVKNDKECVVNVEQERNYGPVCADLCILVKFHTCESNKIHIVTDYSITQIYIVFITRDNFSLFKRLTSIFRYLEEAGVIVYHLNYKEYFSHKKNMQNSDYSDISLDQLARSFILLLCGLILSSIILLIELLVQKMVQCFYTRNHSN